MRRLLLFRHAKAERAQPGSRDSARALSERGRDDAARLGAYIARHSLVPDCALVSPAARTAETWKLAAAAFQPVPLMQSERQIYDASAETLIELIRNAGEPSQTLLVIGHNPGLHECAMRLVASGEVETRARLNEGLPTAGLVIVDFAFDRWDKLRAHTGRLERFVTPKSIEETIN